MKLVRKKKSTLQDSGKYGSPEGEVALLMLLVLNSVIFIVLSVASRHNISRNKLVYIKVIGANVRRKLLLTNRASKHLVALLKLGGVLLGVELFVV